jgi:predicted branched-subunit amino acid permease
MSDTLRDLWRHEQFRAGMRDMRPIALGIAAWGLVTGVAMVKGGLSIPLALAMTFLVFAGSAQLAAIPLMTVGTPSWVIWATALCINLRFIIFSAQLRPYFKTLPRTKRVFLGYFCGDLTYVLFMKRFPQAHEGQGHIEYYIGGSVANWFTWQIASVIGIVLADVVPTHWGLGFAGVLALLGLSYSLVSDRATSLAAVVAGCAAVAAFSLPFRLNIVVAIAAAVCIGLMLDGSGDAGRRIRSALGRAKPASP